MYKRQPFTFIRPLSATSFATVRLLIILDTFKYLSNLIFLTSILLIFYHVLKKMKKQNPLNPLFFVLSPPTFDQTELNFLRFHNPFSDEHQK